eukprot:364312-Chlamydomonas_euryale.AAC.6
MHEWSITSGGACMSGGARRGERGGKSLAQRLQRSEADGPANHTHFAALLLFNLHRQPAHCFPVPQPAQHLQIGCPPPRMRSLRMDATAHTASSI